MQGAIDKVLCYYKFGILQSQWLVNQIVSAASRRKSSNIMELPMSSQRNVIHADEELRFGSQYLRYHVKMYVETLLWLQDQIEKPKGWDTVRNAILESHQVHVRILINFLRKPKQSRETDVFAIDYFHDRPNVFKPLQDDFLYSQADSIGSHLVHITTKPIPKLKSEQDWIIRKTASKLIPAIKAFLNDVPEARLVEGARNDCLNQLARLFLPTIPVSIRSST